MDCHRQSSPYEPKGQGLESFTPYQKSRYPKGYRDFCIYASEGAISGRNRAQRVAWRGDIPYAVPKPGTKVPGFYFFRVAYLSFPRSLWYDEAITTQRR